jgi:hypothetical protein
MSQLGNTLGNRPLIPQLPKRSSRCEQPKTKITSLTSRFTPISLTLPSLASGIILNPCYNSNQRIVCVHNNIFLPWPTHESSNRILKIVKHALQGRKEDPQTRYSLCRILSPRGSRNESKQITSNRPPKYRYDLLHLHGV